VSVDAEGVHVDADDDQMYKMQKRMMKIENYVKESISTPSGNLVWLGDLQSLLPSLTTKNTLRKLVPKVWCMCPDGNDDHLHCYQLHYKH